MNFLPLIHTLLKNEQNRKEMRFDPGVLLFSQFFWGCTLKTTIYRVCLLTSYSSILYKQMSTTVVKKWKIIRKKLDDLTPRALVPQEMSWNL